jgi:hypothetical protein
LRKASPWDSLGLDFKENEREKEVGICYPNLGGVCLTLDAPKWVVPPRFCHESVKNQQVKLVGKAAEITKNLQKIFVSVNQKF